MLLSSLLSFAEAVARYSGRRGALAMVLVSIGALVEGVGVLLLVPLANTLFGTGALTGGPQLPEWAPDLIAGIDPAQRLSVILAAFGALMVLRSLVLWRRDVLLAQLQVGFIEAQRGGLARALGAAPWPALARLGHARVTHLIGSDIHRCGAGVFFLLQSGVAIVMLLAYAGIAFALSPLLAGCALAAMAIGAAVLSRLVRRSQDVGKLVTEANLALMTEIGRFLGGMKVAMSQNLQGGFVAAFERELEKGGHWQIAFARQQAWMRGVWSLLGAGVAGTTMWVGHAALVLPASVLLALLVVLARIAGPASQIHLGVQQIAYSLPAWNGLCSAMRELGNLAPVAAAGDAPAGAIAFSDVSYRHAGDAGLCGVSLTIEPGEIVGISGASGAGKTSLADLLVGLLVPQAGRVTIGGVVLDARNAGGWRDQIAYVAQDPILFDDSVRANLSWANPLADDAAIERALTEAGAGPLVARLPQGLDTRVGARGGLLSGGERQRLGLARALLRAPKLLILDEATSAIDVAGERAILMRLRSLQPRPTILLIAHRGESLALCDRIVTLAEGRLVADERREVAA